MQQQKEYYIQSSRQADYLTKNKKTVFTYGLFIGSILP